MSYFGEAPSDAANTGQYTFGPLEAREVDGSGWVGVSDTDSTEAIVGQSA